MNRKLSRIALAVAAVSILALSACSAPTDDNETQPESKGAIAMGFSNAEYSIWNAQLRLMRPIIEDAGYEFLTDNPENDIARQVASWQGWINRGDVKAIMGFPVQADSIVPVTEEATAAGIPVLGYLLPWEGVTASTVIDPYEGGLQVGTRAGEDLAEQWGSDADLNVMLLTDRSTDLGAAIADGLIEGVTASLPNAKIEELLGNTREDGYNVAQAQLTAEPESYVWLGSSNDGILGVYQALMEQGIAEDDERFYLSSRDANDESLDLIRIPNSIYRPSLIISAQDLAAANARLLIDAAEGKEVEDILVPGVWADATNAAEFYVDK